MEIFKLIFFGIAATMFFALSVKASFKAAAVAGALGGGGYVMYILLCNVISGASAIFFATLTVCLLAECAARFLKTPATVISIPAIIPLVPGLMLYKTLRIFGTGDNIGGAEMLVQTLIFTGCMSLAVTLSTILAKYLFKKRKP